LAPLLKNEEIERMMELPLELPLLMELALEAASVHGRDCCLGSRSVDALLLSNDCVADISASSGEENRNGGFEVGRLSCSLRFDGPFFN
jgi:hypothetical protein